MADQADPAGKKRHPWRWVALGLVVLLALPPLTMACLALPRMAEPDEVAPHDVAIVFGAGYNVSGPSGYLRGRLDLAYELWRTGKAKVLLVSGSTDVGYNEPAVMREYLVGLGVPDDKIVSDFEGNDTYSTCWRARQVFGVERAILVSQTYHLPRAVATCRLVGVDATGVGDSTVRSLYPEKWFRYSLREVPAIYKMTFDIIVGSESGPTGYDPAVDQALEGS